MDLGSGIALGSLFIGIFGLSVTGVIKLTRKNGFVRKDLCMIMHANLEKEIEEMKEKLDKIYEKLIND